MEDLLNDVLYNGLGWEEIGNQGQILFAEPLATPKAVREQLVQMMFEKFNVAGFFSIEQAVLSLYAVGRTSDIAAVIAGGVRHISSRRLETGGSDLTSLFAKELARSNPRVSFTNNDVEKLKEQYGCSAEDKASYDKLRSDCPEEQHTLPDGQVIKIGRERYIVGEALFQPRLFNLGARGVVEQFVRGVSTESLENRRLLLESTLLCGGGASISGFEDRFVKEANLRSSTIRPCLVKRPEYMPDEMEAFSAWTGGAILAEVVFPEKQHITKAEYDEMGPSIVHLKCL